MITFNGKTYDDRHGGPFDRGSADSYYGREFHAHYYGGGTYQGEAIIPEKGSKEYEDYKAGFDYNEALGDKKEW